VRGASSGRGALTLLTGSPSIGKTRPVSEAADKPLLLAVNDGQWADAQRMPTEFAAACAGGSQRERAGGYAGS
jgi:predicted ATPase